MGLKNEKLFLERRLKYFRSGNKDRLLKYASETNRVWLLEYILGRRTKWLMSSAKTLVDIMNTALRANNVDSIMYLIKYNKKMGSVFADKDIYSFVIIALRKQNYDTAKMIIDLSELKLDDFQREMRKDFDFLLDLDVMARKGDIERAKILVEKMGFNKPRSSIHFHSFLEKAARRGHVDFIKYFVKSFDLDPSTERHWAFDILSHAETYPINTLEYILYDYFGNHFKIDFDDDEYIDLENAEEALARRKNEQSETIVA